MGTRTMGHVGCDLHPIGSQRPPADEGDVSVAVGRAARTPAGTDTRREKRTNPRNESMYQKVTFLLITLAAASCSPLKQVQTEQHEALAISDSTLTELFRQEFERQIGTLRQTVVEFYPPAVRPNPGDEQLPDPADTLRTLFPPPKIPAVDSPRQSVKRIIYTEASVQHNKSTQTDSISHSRINTAARIDTQIVTEEKPSSGVAWLQWATALAALVLLILLLFRLR